MKANRRNILRLLGIGAASAPMAAKELEVAALTTLRGASAPALALGAGSIVPQGNGGYAKCASYMKLMGKLPDYVEREVKLRSGYVYSLDPDIACKKSWSLNVKIATQRQRNYERELIAMSERGWFEAAQDAFEKTTGFRWQMW